MNSKRKQRGNMPFALVAVAILLVASAYGVVAGQVADTETDEGHVSTELDSLDAAIAGTQRFVARGLGEIIHDLSTDRSLGTVDARMALFGARADQWLDYQFPAADSGVRVDLLDHDLSLTAEPLALAGATLAGDGYVPTYLRAAGTVTARFTADSGTAERTLTIASDGSCALPLVATQGSLFEQSLRGGGSLLAQYMQYELAALAQYRVLNGYGALAASGEQGTDHILTETDVRQAYRVALNAVESLFFRSTADGTVLGAGTDPAKLLAAPDGYAEIDVDAVYAQALAGAADDIAAKWFDYFLGNSLLVGLDTVDDALRNAWDALTGFLTGRDPFSAASYITRVLGSQVDLSVLKGQTFTVTVPALVTTQNGGTQIPAYELAVAYPTVDVLGSATVRNYVSDYRADNNALRDLLTDVVNQAAAAAGTAHRLGTIRFSVADVSESFPRLLAERLDERLAGSAGLFSELAGSALREQRIADPFIAGIYTALAANKDAIFSYSRSAFNQAVAVAAAPAVVAHAAAQNVKISNLSAVFTLRGILNKSACDEDYYAFQTAADAVLARLAALQGVEAANSSVLLRGCTAILTGGMLVADSGVDVQAHMRQICGEFAANVETNPHGGLSDLADEPWFRLVGAGGAATKEQLTVTDRPAPAIVIGQPSSNLALCTHETGFCDDSGASYCTAFSVSLQDTLPYTVTSTGALAAALGVADAALDGRAAVSVAFKVAVVSGWALRGVPSYAASTTVLDDAERLALAALEPLLVPLREVLGLAEDLLDQLAQALAPAGRFAAEHVAQIYAVLCDPLERLSTFIQERIGDAFAQAALAVAEKLAVTVNADAKHQIIGFSYLGMDLTLTFDAASLTKTTKNLVKAELKTDVNGTAVDAWLNVRAKERSSGLGALVTGGFALDGDGWDLTAALDPLMQSSEHAVSATGTARGVQVDLVLPDLVQYREADLCLSDIPALGAVLGNLPSPIAGTKLILDAGLDLKYAAPFEGGVLVNEFESNPAGEDADGEWAEILNATRTTHDLTGWTLTTSKGKVYTCGAVTLTPGARTVVEFPGTFLMNRGEYLVLRDADGAEQDRTPARSDDHNDDRTNQRGADASTEWVLAAGTPDARNAGGLIGEDGMLTAQVIDIFASAAVKAMGQMKQLGSVADLADYFKLTMRYALDDGLERLASCLVEAAVFVSADVADVSGSGRAGLRLALSAGEELAADLLRFLIGRAEELFLHIADPYGIDLGTAVAEDVYLGVTVYAGLQPPQFLGDLGDAFPDLRLGADVACDLAALGRVFGKDLGTPTVTAGVRILDCPNALVPAVLSPDPTMKSDLWLLRLTLRPAAA